MEDLTREKEIALRLMGKEAQCQHCKFWEPLLADDWGWCEKKRGVDCFNNGHTRTFWGDRCDLFGLKD